VVEFETAAYFDLRPLPHGVSSEGGKEWARQKPKRALPGLQVQDYKAPKAKSRLSVGRERKSRRQLKTFGVKNCSLSQLYAVLTNHSRTWSVAAPEAFRRGILQMSLLLIDMFVRRG